MANWLPSTMTVVFDSIPAEGGSVVDQLWSTRPFCKRKCVLIGDLREVTQAEWGADLAQYAMDEIGLSQWMYQGLRNAFSRSMRGLNPNLVTRHTLRSVCHTTKDLYTMLEVNFSATLPDIGLLEKDRLSKERRADYFRVNLCPYAGSCESETEEDFCTNAFGMQ